VGQLGASLSAASPSSSAAASPSPDLGFISPVVARLAAERGVDLSQVAGTGVGGRITKKDVLAAAEVRPAPVSPSEATEATALPLTNVRRAIAEHMVRSVQTAPHVTTVMEADLGQVVAHRETWPAGVGGRPTYTAYFVVASAAALKAHPEVNSAWGDGQIWLKREINIGVAVATDEGLLVPVIKGADRKSLAEIAAEVSDLATRARDKRLRPDEVTGGTFTLTNHGVTGSLFATPIIHQPQCAILGIGTIEERVRVVEDAVAIRPMAYFSLTFDHRIIDGAIADRFLARVKETVEGWEA
jgi:2-oxoisovalerate dehydrogenase E2 component (dihydrolipoyl transacylase)